LARLDSNEDFPLPVVAALRTLGRDVLTSGEAGNAGQAIPDDAVLDYATRNARAVLTLNRRHFVRPHQSGMPHAGIVVCTVDADFGAQAARIDEAIRPLPAVANQLVRVNRPSP